MHCPEIRLNSESAETATTIQTLHRARVQARSLFQIGQPVGSACPLALLSFRKSAFRPQLSPFGPFWRAFLHWQQDAHNSHY
jgi:hypothetical protein